MKRHVAIRKPIKGKVLCFYEGLVTEEKFMSVLQKQGMGVATEDAKRLYQECSCEFEQVPTATGLIEARVNPYIWHDYDSIPITVRKVAEMDHGYISGTIFATMKKGYHFTVARKQYYVDKISAPKKVSYENKYGKGSYIRKTYRIKDDEGAAYTYEVWDKWVHEGEKRRPTICTKGGSRRKESPADRLSRDIEADVVMDLTQENNDWHEPSDSYYMLHNFLKYL